MNCITDIPSDHFLFEEYHKVGCFNNIKFVVDYANNCHIAKHADYDSIDIVEFKSDLNQWLKENV